MGGHNFTALSFQFLTFLNSHRDHKVHKDVSKYEECSFTFSTSREDAKTQSSCSLGGLAALREN